MQILIPPQQRNGAKNGQMVIVEIERYPDNLHYLPGTNNLKCSAILDPGMELHRRAQSRYSLAVLADVEQEANALADTVLAKDKNIAWICVIYL